MSSGSELRGKSLLTNREREVFELLVQDKTTKEIAAQLFVSEKTVRNHISKEIFSVSYKWTSTMRRGGIHTSPLPTMLVRNRLLWPSDPCLCAV
jgi:LuxR family transcriptional regulator of spore coat protein